MGLTLFCNCAYQIVNLYNRQINKLQWVIAELSDVPHFKAKPSFLILYDDQIVVLLRAPSSSEYSFESYLKPLIAILFSFPF